MTFSHAAKLEELTTETREDYARALFDFEAIKERMTNAASHGYDGMRVVQDRPLTLKDTAAFKNLKGKLEKKNYTLTWINSASGMEGYSADASLAIQFDELLIVWGNPKGNILHKTAMVEKED